MGTTGRPTGWIAAVAALGVVLGLGAAGCSGDDTVDAAGGASPSDETSGSASVSASGQASGSPGASPSPEPERTVIPITVRGDSVEPRGTRVQVTAGEPFVFAIDSDAAGELHVHATPEAELAFGAGRTRKQLVLDRPGIVEVELHEPTEVTVVQLEVR